MIRETIGNEYFIWLCEMVGHDYSSTRVSFEKLLAHLHKTEFTYLLSMDRNRAEDGLDLRYRFSLTHSRRDIPDGPCSVLEMMVALAIRCEENIMDDPEMGDRTGQWFWGMITNLGLGSMTDHRYDRRYVESVVEQFLDRDYYPDGEGGLFTIRNCDCDLRNVEIWHQLCWYLDSITDTDI